MNAFPTFIGFYSWLSIHYIVIIFMYAGMVKAAAANEKKQQQPAEVKKTKTKNKWGKKNDERQKGKEGKACLLSSSSPSLSLSWLVSAFP